MDYVQIGGKPISNYNTTTLVNNTLATREITVTTGKRWYLYGGWMLNNDNVDRSCYINIIDASSNVIIKLVAPTTLAATTGTMAFPNTVADENSYAGAFPIPLKNGWKIQFVWSAGGASAGGTAKSAALVMEVTSE